MENWRREGRKGEREKWKRDNAEKRETTTKMKGFKRTLQGWDWDCDCDCDDAQINGNYFCLSLGFFSFFGCRMEYWHEDEFLARGEHGRFSLNIDPLTDPRC